MCLSHLIYTVLPCLIHTCHAMPMPRSGHAVLLKVTAPCHRQEMACGRRACYRLLPATTRSSRKVVIRSKLISVAGGQREIKHEEKLIIFVQGHECLYSLKHKDYDKSLLKDNTWKEIAGEVHAQGKEQATQYFVHYRKAYCWYVFVLYYSDNAMALF